MIAWRVVVRDIPTIRYSSIDAGEGDPFSLMNNNRLRKPPPAVTTRDTSATMSTVPAAADVNGPSVSTIQAQTPDKILPSFALNCPKTELYHVIGGCLRARSPLR